MSVLAQQVVSGVLVLASAGYATWSLWLRRRWRARQAAAGAGCGCDGCDVAKPAKTTRG